MHLPWPHCFLDSAEKGIYEKTWKHISIFILKLLSIKSVQMVLQLILFPMFPHQSTENAHSYFCKEGKKFQNQAITWTLFRV